MKRINSLLLLLLCVLAVNAQICYRISGNGLKNDSFIFGTHHLAPLSVFLEKEEVKAAFESSNQVVGEVDMTINQMEMAMKMQSYMVAPADSTLSKVLSEEDYSYAIKAFPEIAPELGLSFQMLDALKPSAVTQMVVVPLMMKYLPEFNPNEQLDTYFQKQGKETGKKIIGLETVEYQANILYNSKPIRIQAEELMEILRNPEKAVEESKVLNEAYFTEDMDVMYSISKDLEEDQAYYEALLKNRNLQWMDKLPIILNEDSTFIAVGCLHLVGEYGLIKMLRDKGYVVEAIDYVQN